jgi:hypothetical protein
MLWTIANLIEKYLFSDSDIVIDSACRVLPPLNPQLSKCGQKAIPNGFASKIPLILRNQGDLSLNDLRLKPNGN